MEQGKAHICVKKSACNYCKFTIPPYMEECLLVPSAASEASVSLLCSLWCPSYRSCHFDESKFLCFISHQCSSTVSLETNLFIHFTINYGLICKKHAKYCQAHMQFCCVLV